MSLTAKDVVAPKSIVEYPLQCTNQTHTMAILGDKGLIVVTQEPTSGILKISRDDKNRVKEVATFTLGTSTDGLHCIYESKVYPGMLWGTLKMKNQIVLIDVHSDKPLSTPPTILKTIDMPSPSRGPHEIVEDGSYIYIACKVSGHVVKINHFKTQEFEVYPCSAAAIFVAVHPTSKKVYSSIFPTNKLFELDQAKKTTREIPLKLKTTAMGPLGVMQGPDGNLWFVQYGMGGTANGSFGKIDKDGNIRMFKLSLANCANAGFIHLQFETGKNMKTRLHLLPTTLFGNTGFDGIVTVTFTDDTMEKIATQTSYTFPSQGSWAHRVCVSGGDLFISNMKFNTLTQVFQHNAVTGGRVPADMASDYYGFYGLGVGDGQTTYDIVAPLAQ